MRDELFRAIRESLRECDCSWRDKALVRGAMLTRNGREAIRESAIDFLESKGAQLPVGADLDIELDPDKFREWLELLKEWLPEIIDMIKMLIALFT